MQKIIDIVNKEFKERTNLGGNWEAYEVEDYLDDIKTSLISKIEAINVMRCSMELCECVMPKVKNECAFEDVLTCETCKKTI